MVRLDTAMPEPKGRPTADAGWNGPLPGRHTSVAIVSDALRGRRVLVTGHTGFKGSWLTLWLARMGAEVHGYALDPPTSPSHFETSRVGRILASDTRADVSDSVAMRSWVADRGPDVLFHLAAAPIVRQARVEPRATFETNVLGTVNVLEAVRLAGRPCALVVVTTDKCYLPSPDGAANGYNEESPLGGDEPYAASKAAAEIAVAGYRGAFFPRAQVPGCGVVVATARAGNVIGGGDFAPDRLLPDVVRALAADRPVPVRFPSAVRPWQHVLDPLWGYLQLGAALLGADGSAYAEAWNFGPRLEDQVPVRHVVEQAISQWGSGSWAQEGDGQAPGETAELRLRSEKAQQRLEWLPRWSVEDAVARAVRWYARHAAAPGSSTEPSTIDDISAYEDHLGQLATNPAEVECPVPRSSSPRRSAVPAAPTAGDQRIDGVVVAPRRQIVDDRGRIVHMLRRDDPEFQQFGEVYFSWVRPGKIKAWHLHRAMTLHYTCPVGAVLLVLYDDRAGSPTRGAVEEIVLSPEHHVLVRVPPGVWNGFAPAAGEASMVCNCATLPHDPEEIVRLPHDDPRIPYTWPTTN